MEERAPAEDAPAPRREPAFNIPAVVVAWCLLLLAIHGGRLLLSAETDNALVAALAFVPARVTLALHIAPDRLVRAYQAFVGHSPIVAAQLDFLLGDGAARPWTVLTYALLHASWAHVGFNCVWLVAFGAAVARRFSALRFSLLLVVAAVAGALAQYLCDVAGFQLVIGASAAVSGVIGTAARFVFRPAGEPRPAGRGIEAAFRLPALSLRETVTTRTALLFVVVWFASDLLFGLFPALSGVGGDAPVAWQAHIGGFLAGLLLFPLFDAARPADPARLPGEEDVPGLVLGHDEPPPAA